MFYFPKLVIAARILQPAATKVKQKFINISHKQPICLLFKLFWFICQPTVGASKHVAWRCKDGNRLPFSAVTPE
ncbi:hypothetical protein WG68_07565 [Arsukibacterium ikkense]|uniref:Uncharacterized protein n=1 Tax=Arsukibacterium ikkense TaxID=336831 RepID=A0A0M2V890_9GAMM|nr:hypothetical protein WG68_07565 [Arsukibacterium ikkense]